MPAIFISYRRDDSAGYAGRVYDRLCAHFGSQQVFMDVDGIKLGDDFVRVLAETEKRCSALLVVIGRSWLTIASATGTARLFDPQDFVRREIAAAFEANIQLCPVLVGGAGMPPAEQLPEALAPLARVQAMVLHDTSFQRDVDQLIAALDQIVSPPPLSADFVGTWRATVQYNWGVTYEEVFKFELDDEDLLGSATYVTVPRVLQDAKIAGNKISFLTKSTSMAGDKTYEEKHQYSGKLVEGKIKFRLQTESGYDSRLPETFTATRDSV
jgi:TIR domain-containing protein